MPSIAVEIIAYIHYYFIMSSQLCRLIACIKTQPFSSEKTEVHVKKDSNGTTTTILSTHIQWYWKSRRDPWASIDVNEWEPYSDDQNRIIEKAFRNNAEYVNLKESDYIIDLKRLIQMNARDSTKQPPIKRVNLEDQSHPTN
ncbi:unnamed protein product [Rotaria sp. Silwood1]|nr:unnamed protein product [Rotaria sp. Silwood1]CAF3556535.1 unnamed protein product [Rotaria sp. Silwood1]CAF3607911.1 unnamed protein product [Rotaria sp. Silwood1]CAF4664822.1 unnamed protein product [Rotaria sp. Silwood1]CAF4687382.1 unnamed protein product [Rotaria sp. Silwood1]